MKGQTFFITFKKHTAYFISISKLLFDLIKILCGNYKWDFILLEQYNSHLIGNIWKAILHIYFLSFCRTLHIILQVTGHFSYELQLYVISCSSLLGSKLTLLCILRLLINAKYLHKKYL